MTKIPRKWRKKREDASAGLIFDWRSTGVFSWRIVFFVILFGIILIFLMNLANVSVLDSNLRRSHYSGMVFFLNSDPSVKVQGERSNPSPLLNRTPVWADPVHLGGNGGAFVPLSAGLGDHSARLLSVDMSNPRSLQSSLLTQFSYPEPTVGKWMQQVPETPSLSFPVASASDEDLKGMVSTNGSKPVLGRNFSGLQTLFWVVVSPWGVPVNIVVMEGSGNESADEAAMDYVREMRWLPAATARSGMLSIHWKEKGE